MADVVLTIEANDEYSKQFGAVINQLNRLQNEARQTNAETNRLSGANQQLSNSYDTARVRTRDFTNNLLNSVFIVDIAARSISTFARNLIEVGRETERYQAVLRATETDYENVFMRLQQLNRELIGTDFSTINRTFLQLRAAGAGIETTITNVTGLSRAMGQLAVNAQDQQRFFTQLTQAYGQNRLEADEFKILQEVLPNILRLSSRALGQQITSHAQLKEVLDESNLSAQDYFNTLGQFASVNIEGIDTSTFAAQSELLAESIRELQRDISEFLIPVLARGARSLREFVEFFTALSGREIEAFVSSMTAATVGVVSFVAILRAARTVSLEYVGVLNLGTTGLSVFTDLIRFRAIDAWNSFRASLIAAASAQLTFNQVLTIGAPLLFAYAGAMAYFSVRAEVAANSATELQEAFARTSEFFTFDNQLDRVRRFSDLSVEQLGSVVRAYQDARRIAVASLDEIASRFTHVANAQELLAFNLDDFFASILDTSGTLREEVETLINQYNIAERGISTFTQRIAELKAETQAAADAQKELVRTVNELNLSLSTSRSDLQVAESNLSQALAGEDIGAIRAALSQVIAERRRAADIEFDIFSQGEDNREVRLARAITLQTNLRRSIESVAQRVEKRITDITNAEIEARSERFRRYIDFEIAALDARERAYAEREKRITDNYIAELQQRQRIEAIAIQSGIELQQRLRERAFRRDATANLGQEPFAPDNQEAFQRADRAERARELLRIFERRQASRDSERQIQQDRIEISRIFGDIRNTQEQIQAQESARAQEQEYRQSLNRQRRDARRFSNDIVNLIDSVAIRRTQTIQQAVLDFIAASVRRVAQNFIETQLLIANERRLQEEYRRSNELKNQQADGLGSLGTIGSIFAGVATAGANPLGAVASLAGFAPQITNLLKIGSNEAREIGDFLNSLGRDRRD